jgi:hypothetical protein
MVEAGAKMITVHGRTRTQGFSGTSDPEIIRLVRLALPSHIPLVGNGDIVDVEGYLRLREYTGCDAVMIGRGAMGNPWLFARLREVLAGRPDPGQPSLEARLTVFRRHVGLIEELKSGPRTLHEVRKACAWYARGLYGCNALRLRVAVFIFSTFFNPRFNPSSRRYRAGPVDDLLFCDLPRAALIFILMACTNRKHAHNDTGPERMYTIPGSIIREFTSFCKLWQRPDVSGKGG